MKKMRRVLALMLVFVMALALSACGSKDGSLSKSDYKKKIVSISKEVETESANFEAASTLAATDPAKALEDMTAAVDKIKPLYKELGELKAPKDYSEQQTKIKTGSDATIEVLELTVELLEASTAESPDTAKVEELTTNFQTKTAELTTALTDMDNALTEVTK